MVENAQEALALLDARFDHVLVNSTYARLVGRGREQLTGLCYFDLFPNPEDEAAFRRARDMGQPLRGQQRPVEIAAPQGPQVTYWDWTLVPVTDQRGRVENLVLSLVDVTRRVQAQRELEDFVQAVSHDLRSPLTAVLGQAQIIQRVSERPDQAQRSAAAIVIAARRMNATIQELVDLVRAQTTGVTLNRVPVKLPKYVADLKRHILETRDGDRLEIEDRGGLPAVWADPLRLERIVTNLLGSALRHADPGSKVLVSFEPRDEEIVTSVACHGPGVSPEELSRLSQPEQPGLPGRRATDFGFGLHVARVLVEAHGGRAEVESGPGDAVVFRFSLPVAEDRPDEGGPGRTGRGAASETSSVLQPFTA